MLLGHSKDIHCLCLHPQPSGWIWLDGDEKRADVDKPHFRNDDSVKGYAKLRREPEAPPPTSEGFAHFKGEFGKPN
ncbi:hypothetical protein NECAME_15801 [Necator americanus]|uniref:Uncharacterized protein n=1 Tax=Necator americanus TaxID=51031 RepID=W2SG05_NECAM|nr:hypothetical protein NECAME_15801 [Necator americanus]ETN68468.1 hypothetical protein NECAME_15801 [Necator americanus]